MTHSEKVVLNLSALDYGGAGKFAVDFSKLLREEGLSSYLVVKDSKTSGEGIIPYQDSSFRKPVGKFLRKFYKQKLTDDLFDYDFYFYNKYETLSVVSARQILAQIPQKPDVIFVHWVTDFINANVLHELKQLTNAKIYWLLIDNAPLTGGCHYPWTCAGYMQDCANCPAILTEQYKWVATDNLAFKKKYLPADIGVIAFSASDYNRARKSSLFRDKQVVKIPGFVDETLFKPDSKVNARHQIGLPADKKIIFFGAFSLTEKRKGIHLLIEALSLLINQDYFLLIAGKLTASLESLPAKYIGYLTEKELITAYQAADVFVCPSIEDSGPMMINQSLMCGTPVVAFDTGVAQDLVITGKTGYKVTTICAQSLANGIEAIFSLSSDRVAELSDSCRSMAERMTSKAVYMSSIRQLIDESSSHE